MPAMRRRPVQRATSLPVPSLIVTSSHGEPSGFGTMRTEVISPTTDVGTRGCALPIGSTPGWAEQKSRRRSSSSTSTGAVSLWKRFFSATGAVREGVVELDVVEQVGAPAAHDEPDL